MSSREIMCKREPLTFLEQRISYFTRLCYSSSNIRLFSLHRERPPTPTDAADRVSKLIDTKVTIDTNFSATEWDFCTMLCFALDPERMHSVLDSTSSSPAVLIRKGNALLPRKTRWSLRNTMIPRGLRVGYCAAYMKLFGRAHVHARLFDTFTASLYQTNRVK